MAFFRFPRTDFNQINLDWIMRTIKKLEPAATMVEESQAALEQAQATAEAAQATAAAAAATIGTVTEQAADALETSAEALEVAQQAASGVIGDGAVTRIKLSTEVRDELDGLRSDVDSASSSASMAMSAATTAQRQANDATALATSASAAAQSAATQAANADTTAQNAATTAENASTSATTALSTAAAAQEAVASKLTAKRLANATANVQTSYTLTGSPINMYLIVLTSNEGANHNTIYWVNTGNGRIRLLGNVASGITPSFSGGQFRVTTTAQCFVWSFALPNF